MFKKKRLTWDDTEKIAKALLKKYPDSVPVALDTEKIRQRVVALPGFNDSEHPDDEIYLASIQYKWINLWHGNDVKPSKKESASKPPKLCEKCGGVLEESYEIHEINPMYFLVCKKCKSKFLDRAYSV